MQDEKMSLDTDAPDKVSGILRDVAQKYRESASELEAAWQDKSAGKPWGIIADELDRCADRIDKKLKSRGY